jgi:hypothetical protein
LAVAASLKAVDLFLPVVGNQILIEKFRNSGNRNFGTSAGLASSFFVSREDAARRDFDSLVIGNLLFLLRGFAPCELFIVRRR